MAELPRPVEAGPLRHRQHRRLPGVALGQELRVDRHVEAQPLEDGPGEPRAPAAPAGPLPGRSLRPPDRHAEAFGRLVEEGDVLHRPVDGGQIPGPLAQQRLPLVGLEHRPAGRVDQRRRAEQVVEQLGGGQERPDALHCEAEVAGPAQVVPRLVELVGLGLGAPQLGQPGPDLVEQ